MTNRDICIVIPDYAVSTPRAIKEADALHEAGFRIRLVSSRGQLREIAENDRELLAKKPWESEVIRWSLSEGARERAFHRITKVRSYLSRCLPLPSAPWAASGECRVYPELAAAARRRPAALFIGHYPAGLVAAASGAARWKARLGYDMEDLHVTEHLHDAAKTARIRLIEQTYAPRCASRTAVSDRVAAEISRLYGFPPPLVIRNVFPWAERAGLDGRVLDRRGPKLSLYWYSQSVGLDRGIQDAITASGALRGRVQLHLRGSVDAQTRRVLTELARKNGIGEDLYFHPAVSPAELLSRSAEHDVGLALEQPVSRNRELTASNKFFYYLLAGLAVAVTDVPGQRDVFEPYPGAGVLYRPGDTASLAAWLVSIADDPARLRSCRETALRAARERWNWETESRALVDQIRKTLA
ncbi:MAG TPA: hypothetical protein VL404_02340 [Candidatus Eisenbacteria bacterium]|nr:hypothetical protein [Candidatus Eisenbacteria bacterium]